MSRWLYFGALGAALAYGVAQHGGRHLPPAWDVCLLIIGLTGLGHWARRSRTSGPSSTRVPWVAWGAVLMPAYIGLQLIPLPRIVLRGISPARADLISSLAVVATPPAFAPITVDFAATSAWLLTVVA